MRRTRKEKERAQKVWAERAELTRFGLGKIAESLARAARDLYQRGWQRVQEGRLDEAQEALRKSLEIFPDAVDALRALGRLLLETDRAQEAVAIFGKVIDQGDANGEDFFYLGEALLQTGRRKRAVEAFDQAVTLGLPDRLRREAEQKRADALEALKSSPLTDETARELEEALYWASFYLDMGFPRRAREYAERALSLAPNDPRAQQMRHRIEEAIARLTG